MENQELLERRNVLENLKLKRAAYRDSVSFKDYEKWQQSCLNKIRAEYKNKEPELAKYTLYHFIVGGGDQLDCEWFDFPGEFSIQKMTEDLAD